MNDQLPNRLENPESAVEATVLLPPVDAWAEPVRRAAWPTVPGLRSRDRSVAHVNDSYRDGPSGAGGGTALLTRERVGAGAPSFEPSGLAELRAQSISAWFGNHQVLDRVSLTMPAGRVTALIGPSGCGKSTFLRILNRMHELVPSASLAGEVLLDGVDVYDATRKLTQARRDIGMVFQKPNPFPAMSIRDNVLAGLKLTGVRATGSTKDALVEESLTKAGLWREVRDRLSAPGGTVSVIALPA